MVLAIMYRYPSLRGTVSSQLVMFQTASWLLESVTNIALPSGIHVTCVMKAASAQYAYHAAYAWACVMVFVVSRIVTREAGTLSRYQPKDHMHWFHLFCW
jgi:hypothetical protein